MRLLNMLFGALILGALGWTGWWYAVATGQEEALERWFESRAEEGWQAEYAEISLTGFPTRLEREITEIRLADPETGWAWAAPRLVIESGPLGPTRFAVTWPGNQSFAVPGESTEIASTAMATRLELRPESALALVRASAETAGLDIKARSGWRASAAAFDADVSERLNNEGYEIAFLAERVVLPKPLLARLDPLGVAGPEIERMTVDGAAVFDRPLDRNVIEDGKLGLREATLRRAGFQWGEIRLEAKGEVRVDKKGYPVGDIDVTARHWRELLAMARRSGALRSEIASAIEGALELIAMIGGNRDELDVPLRFEDGRIWVGPVPVGDAPRLAPARS